jgi:DNA-binding transcriptional MerR regulator
VSVPDVTFSIGVLAERTGVPATTLRYYDELGLVPPLTREAGRRRYDDTAVAQVGVILVLRDAGFTLAEILELGDREHWQQLAARKLDQLADLAARVQVARTALEHALCCPHGNPRECPTFWSIVGARLQGRSLAEAHTR